MIGALLLAVALAQWLEGHGPRRRHASRGGPLLTVMRRLPANAAHDGWMVRRDLAREVTPGFRNQTN